MQWIDYDLVICFQLQSQQVNPEQDRLEEMLQQADSLPKSPFPSQRELDLD